MSRWPWVLLFVATVAVAAPPESPAQRAQRQATAQKQLAQVRAQIQALSDEQKKIEDAKGDASQALREVDGKVGAAQRHLRATEVQIDAQEKALAELQQRQLVLESGLSRQRAELALLVRSAYALGQQEQLKLLLEQDRIADLARVLAYHRYFQDDRRQRIGDLTDQLQSLAAVSEQVKADKAALETTRARQQAELAALAGQRRQRSTLVAQLDKRYRDRGARLSALGRNEKDTVALLERLRKLMAQMPRPAATPGARKGDPAIPTGPLNLPLAGKVLAGFGGTMPDGHESKGLLIAGSAGAQVHAVAAGRVAFADWLKGYGLLMIIDHGDGLMTLYAFNDALLKNTGDSVRAGEAISTVGSSGGQGEPALYFELRRNGQPQNPTSLLRK